MAYVTGAAILTHVGAVAPSATDTAWADDCADAVEAAIATMLDGLVVASGSAAEAELTFAALQDGAAAYIERKAPHGVLSIGPDGETVRLGADIIRALRPVLRRYVAPPFG